MHFEHSPKTKEWMGRVQKFMDDHIIPAGVRAQLLRQPVAGLKPIPKPLRNSHGPA